MTYENRVPRQAWLDAYLLVLDALPERPPIQCPNCGHRTLRIAFQGRLGDPIGRAYFWCDTCLFGLGFGRVLLPEGVEVLPYEITDEQLLQFMPSYRLIPPERTDNTGIEIG